MSRRRKYPATPRGFPAGTVYPTLDLHGLTAEEATSRTLGWLERCQEEGELSVHVITGRGRHSVGPAVLPGEIAHLLNSRPTLVGSYEKDPSGGAFHVRLKPPPPLRSARPVALPDDPELLRRAEEALADLGIASTPILIAAEVERIRAEDTRKGR